MATPLNILSLLVFYQIDKYYSTLSFVDPQDFDLSL